MVVIVQDAAEIGKQRGGEEEGECIGTRSSPLHLANKLPVIHVETVGLKLQVLCWCSTTSTAPPWITIGTCAHHCNDYESEASFAYLHGPRAIGKAGRSCCHHSRASGRRTQTNIVRLRLIAFFHSWLRMETIVLMVSLLLALSQTVIKYSLLVACLESHTTDSSTGRHQQPVR